MQRTKDEEISLWRDAMRDVKPLRRVARRDPAPEPMPAATRRAAARHVALPHHAPGTGIDRRSAQRLKRGRMEIEARLDLHGMTEAEAHGALERFIAGAAAAGRRCLLIVTGKGSGGKIGVLRAAVPRWLGEGPNRGLVLDFVPAQPRDGGAGALYVLLRRRR